MTVHLKWLALFFLAPVALETRPVVGQAPEQSKMPGEDGRWAFVWPGTDGIGHIDTTTVVRLSNSTYRFWFRSTYTKPQGEQGYVRSMERLDLDCQAKQFKIREQILYDGDGNVISSHKLTEPEWREPVPETKGEFLMVLGCLQMRRKYGLK